MVVMVISILVMLGCKGGEILPVENESGDPIVMIEQCQTSDCKSKWGVLAWRKGVHLGGQIMPTLTSLEQQVIMSEILAEQPTWLPREFCDSLSDSSVEKSCLRLMSRPHLWAVTKKSLNLFTVKEQSFQFQKITDDCGTLGCWQSLAVEKVREGKYQLAGKHCASEPVKTLREECYFKIAEVATLGVEQSMAYCYLASTYQSNCYEHLIESYSKLTATQFDSWSRARGIDMQLKKYWESLDPQFGMVIRARLWGEVARLNIEKSTNIGAKLLQEIPVEHHIQLISAFSHFLIRETADLSIDGLLAQLELVMVGKRSVKVQGSLPNRIFRLRFIDGVRYHYILGKSIRPVFSESAQRVGAIAEALYLEKKLTATLLKQVPCQGELVALCNELKPFVQPN